MRAHSSDAFGAVRCCVAVSSPCDALLRREPEAEPIKSMLTEKELGHLAAAKKRMENAGKLVGAN